MYILEFLIKFFFSLSFILIWFGGLIFLTKFEKIDKLIEELEKEINNYKNYSKK